MAAKIINGMSKAWFDAKNATLKSLKQAAKDQNKEMLQLVFMALGDGDRQKLNVAILNGFAKNMTYQEKLWFEAEYSIRYPA